MNMDKCREAFEAKYKESHPDDKSTMMPNGNYSGWIKQVYWEAWQSRQAEVDELQANLDRADEIATRENNRANKLQKDNTRTTILLGKTIVKKEALEASIAKALVKWSSIVSILTTSHVKVPDEVFQKLDDLEKALRGEHE